MHSSSHKILLVSSLSDKPGGAETAFISLSDQLCRLSIGHYRANNGIKFTRSSDRRFAVPLARVYAKHGMPTVNSVISMLSSCINVLRLLAAVKPKLVNIHYIDTASLYFFLFRRIFGYRIILTSHGSDILSVDPAGLNLSTRYLRWALKSADAISAVSPQVLAKAKSFLNGSATAMFLTPNGIDCSAWRRRSQEPRSQVISSVGALKPIKGHDVLIEAFALARKVFPLLRLVIAGDGPSRESLEMLAQHHALADDVEFSGQLTRSQVRDLLANSTVFVIPSRSEGFGIAALEAMASGVPVIAANVGGLPSIIQHQVNGILVDSDCPQSLADAIETLVKDPDYAQTLAARACETAEEFSLTRMAKNYHEMYLSMMKTKSN